MRSGNDNERASVPRAKAASGGGSIIDRNKRDARPGVRGAETCRNAVIRSGVAFQTGSRVAVRDRDHSPARQDVGGRAQRLRAADQADGVWVPGGTGDTDDPQDTRQEAEEPHGSPRHRRRRRIPAFVGREVSVFLQRRYTDTSFLSVTLVHLSKLEIWAREKEREGEEERGEESRATGMNSTEVSDSREVSMR